MSGIMKEGSLGAILHTSNIITEDDIRAALDEQATSGLRFGEALVRLGIVTQEDIDWALSNQLDIPYVRIKKNMVDPDAVALVPAAVARKYAVFPLVKAGDELSVAIADPLNKEAVAAVERVSGCHISLSMGLIREIREMQDEFYGPATEDSGTLGFVSASFSAAVLAAINADLTGAALVDYLLLFVRQNRLSSLLLLPSSAGVVITGARGAVTKRVGTLRSGSYGVVVDRLAETAGTGASDSEPRTGKIFLVRGEDRSQFRLDLLPTSSGYMVTVRPDLPIEYPTALADLPLPGDGFTRLQALLSSQRGFLFVAGEDGEARRRILTLLLEELYRAGRAVVAVGDLSCGLPLVVATGDALPGAVEGAIRQAVDVVALSNLDDLRTVRAARRAVLAGKMVVAGLAAIDVAGTIRDIFNQCSRDAMSEEDVTGFVTVAELPILCPHCRADGSSSGCSHCSYTGYAGRKLVAEAVPRRAWSDGPRKVDAALAMLADAGVITLAEQARALVEAGEAAPHDLIAAGLE